MTNLNLPIYALPTSFMATSGETERMASYRTTRNQFATTIILAASMIVASSSTLAGGLLSIPFNVANFTNNPTIIDNPYWPLLPGGVASRTFTYLGETEDECVVNTVASEQGEIKMDFEDQYAAIAAQVVRDQEWVVADCDTVPTDADLKEFTFDWYAQDNNGNVWYFGEASRDFEDGCPSLSAVPLGTEDWGDYGLDDLQEDCTGGSWEAGQLGPDGEIIGQPGIVVPSDDPYGPDGEPLSPGNYYMQEVAEGAEDMGKILSRKASVSIESGAFEDDYENCRKVKEWTALEPGASVEHKYYCAGIGLILINGIGGGPTESEVLVSIVPTP